MNFDQLIDRTGTYCTQWDYVADRFGQSDLLPFTISDTDFALPDAVLDKLNQRLSHPVFGYTRWNHMDFKKSIHYWYQERFATRLSSDWIVYSPSVIYSLSKLMQLKSETGEGVILQTPAYDAFFKTILGNKRTIVENPLLYEEGKYRIDFEQLEEKMKHPRNKILLFCSPHNPTGRVWSQEELKKIIALCSRYQVFLISDEIHMDILRKGYQRHPILQFIKTHVALLTSGSKTFNFPGLLFSYLLIPDPDLRARFLAELKNRDGLSSPSALGMEATMIAYQECGTWVDELNDYLDKNMAYATNYIQKQLPELKVTFSEATYLMWLDSGELPYSMIEMQNRLIEKGKVAIMDGKIYGGNGDQFLRLNVGCSRLKLYDGLQRLKKSLSY